MKDSAYRIDNQKSFLIKEYFNNDVSADDVTWIDCGATGVKTNIAVPFETNGDNIGDCLSITVPYAKEYIVLDFSNETDDVESLKEYSYITYPLNTNPVTYETVDMLNPMIKVKLTILSTIPGEEGEETVETPALRKFYVIGPTMNIYCIFIETVVSDKAYFTRAYLMNGGRFDTFRTSSNMLIDGAAMNKLTVIRPVKLINKVFNAPSEQMNTIKDDGHRVGAFYPYKKLIYKDITPCSVYGKKTNMFLFEDQEVQISASSSIERPSSNDSNVYISSYNDNSVNFRYLTGYIFTPVPNYDLTGNISPASVFLYSRGDLCPNCGSAAIVIEALSPVSHNFGEVKCQACSSVSSTFPSIVGALTYKVTKLIRSASLPMNYYLKPITA